MEFWGPVLFAVGMVVGIIVSSVLSDRRRARQPPPPPTIAGQPTRGLVAVDFGKWYDLVTRPRVGNEPVIFRRCRIRGLTGEDVREGGGWSSAAFLYGWMHRWLALELGDGRVVYLPTESVLYIEESPPSGPHPADPRAAPDPAM